MAGLLREHPDPKPVAMKFCDITISYNENSGGIRTYLDQKRKYLLEQTDHEHILIVPGDHDDLVETPRTKTYYVAAPLIPGHAPYRMFWRPGPIAHILDECSPDIVELGSYYVSAWSAFAYRDRQQKRQHPVCVGGYFHTDVSRALVAGPLDQLISESVSDWSSLLESLGHQMAHMLSLGVERYIDSVFEHCDLAMAASAQQADRLMQYGVPRVEVVPLGVDLELFHPSKRSPQLRGEHGCGDNDILLMYGGRLNEEKDTLLLLEAYRLLPQDQPFHLIILGEGPHREELTDRSRDLPRVHILPYCSDQQTYASLIASADIYVTAGPYETFGLSVVEAQAAGLPVVGVHAGALPERVPAQTGLLGPPHDAAAFARNILAVARDREQYSQAAQNYARQNYSWNNTFETELQLYHSRMEQLAVGEAL